MLVVALIAGRVSLLLGFGPDLRNRQILWFVVKAAEQIRPDPLVTVATHARDRLCRLQ